MAKLAAKQELFCHEYLIDNNATKSAIRAGYSEKTARSMGYENLTKPHIVDRIAVLRSERMNRLDIDKDYVLTQAVKLHERCMQEVPVLDEEGVETGEYKFEHTGANAALKTIGQHTDVRAFEPGSNDNESIIVVIAKEFENL